MCSLLIARRQNIGALKGLIEVSEDVEYRDQALSGVSGTSHIYIDGWLANEWLEEGRYLQVFMPPSCSYVPLGTYPEDTTGGVLQQAWLWPWIAGIVTMVAILQL